MIAFCLKNYIMRKDNVNIQKDFNVSSSGNLGPFQQNIKHSIARFSGLQLNLKAR